MRNRIWILGILLVLSVVCTAKAEDEQPSCGGCEDVCKFAEDIDELEMLRTLYQSREIRREAAAAGGHNPVVTFNLLVQRELDKWFAKGNAKYCPPEEENESGDIGATKPPKDASPFMATNNTTCAIDQDMTEKARKKYCETRIRYYLNHEQHHVDWCKAGKEDPEDGDSYDDYNKPCYATWLRERNDEDDAQERARKDKKEKECNLEVVNALGDEEVAAYDLALGQARMELKKLYLECRMEDSADALEKVILQETRIKEMYFLLERGGL